MGAIFTIIPLLVFLSIFVFIICMFISFLKSENQRNEYLREIRDELRTINKSNQNE